MEGALTEAPTQLTATAHLQVARGQLAPSCNGLSSCTCNAAHVNLSGSHIAQSPALPLLPCTAPPLPQATGRKKLLVAGIVTDVCVLFPTLSALAEGYEVRSAGLLHCVDGVPAVLAEPSCSYHTA
jgi:hypothetical protein